MNKGAKDFIKIMGELDRSKHQGEIFNDFCELAFCALAKAACPFDDQRDKLEAQYMGVVGRYRNKDDIRRMPELMGLALNELSIGGCDFLGQVAGEMGVLNDKLGQFFTPYEVSRLMADITLTGIEDKIQENGFVTVQEPAAGAGGMLIAVADKIESLGFDLETALWIEATELSRATFHMCYIQCAGRGLAGRIINGNSLSLETYATAHTAAAHKFYAKHGTPFAKQQIAAKERAAAQEVKNAQDATDRQTRIADMAAAPAVTGEQLTFF
jgi:type I restriction-modification system DNA methylase subunit